jgi:predicted alpha/beta hydrolase family esterase
MRDTTLIVPGFHGSGPDHWQTWMESQVTRARRVAGIDWESPVLGAWVAALRREVLRSPGRVWLVAHSFGCLVAVVAGAGLAGRVAGAMLVAPANPERFSPQGLRQRGPSAVSGTLSALLRRQHPGFPTLVVASSNDPWMPVRSLAGWTAAGGSHLIASARPGTSTPRRASGPGRRAWHCCRRFRPPRRASPAGGSAARRPLRVDDQHDFCVRWQDRLVRRRLADG